MTRILVDEMPNSRGTCPFLDIFSVMCTLWVEESCGLYNGEGCKNLITFDEFKKSLPNRAND